LIVLGVSKEQPQRTGFLESFAKCSIAGLSRCILRAFAVCDLDNLGEHRGEPPRFSTASRSGRNVGGILLELVINNHGANLKAEFRELMSGSPRESEGIPTSAQGDEIETFWGIIE
jgi:hypothetical protein